METISKGFFSKFTSKKIQQPRESSSESTTVTGTPEVIAQYVYQDILSVKNEIKKYNEVTGLFTTNSLYYKLLKLLEENHSQELQKLRKRYDYDLKSVNYQRQLIAFYKKNLADYSNFLDTLKNNYNHGIHESHIVNYRLGSSLSDLSESENETFSYRNSSVSSASEGSLLSGAPSQPKLSAVLSDAEVNEKISDEAPDMLLDPISFTLFSDPVLTPSGITFERSHLLDHLQTRGKFNPLTRTPLHEHQLYPNLVVKDAVEQYIKTKEGELANCVS